ncbi:MAG: hypothetical protein JWP12_415 [Bacteroidetes bacterium]|nr:hypothetical protein [Bacteroidota bacterium]
MGIAFAMGIPYTAFLIYLIVQIILTLKRNEKKCKSTTAAGILLFSEILFTVVGPALGFYRFDAFGPEIPFAKQHVLIIILLSAVGSASFWLARATKDTDNLFVRIFLSAGMLQGIILCAVVTIHFTEFLLMGIVFPWAGFELLCPLVAFFMLIRELYFYNRVNLDMDELLPYRRELGVEPVQYKLFQQPLPVRLFVYAAIVVVLVIVQVLLGYAIGLQPDSIIKAFTQSVGFVFSR